MSGPKRNPDKLNTIGIIVVGICGAVLVYVTIVALEAFYVNDSSEIQMMADYGGQDTNARTLRTEQLNRVGEYATNPRPAAAKPNEAAKIQSYRIPVEVAMKLVVDAAKADPSTLVPAIGRADKSTVLPIFGRPKLIQPPPAAPAAGGAAGSAAPGAGSAVPGAGSAAPAAGGNATTLPSAPQVPTGTGTGPSPVGGAGPLDKSPTPGTPENPTGPTPEKPTRGASAAGTATHAGSNATKPRTPTRPAPKAGSAAPAKGNDK